MVPSHQHTQMWMKSQTFLSRYKVQQKVITITAIRSAQEQMLPTDSGLRSFPPPFPTQENRFECRA